MDWVIWVICAVIGWKIISGVIGFVAEVIWIVRPQTFTLPDGSVTRAKPVGTFEITYRDRFGEVTRRTIKPLVRSEAGDPIITSYCDLRREVRTFRASRIIECVDLETGEVIENLADRVPTGDNV